MNELTKIPRPAAEPVVSVSGTWDGVRHWLNAAKMFEQGKLFSQVMTGFELLALKKAHGVVNGGDRKSVSHYGKLIGSNVDNQQLKDRASHDGKSSWEEILQQETGLAQSTAYRYMDMAKIALPRLKKLPALKNFDPSTTPIAQLGRITSTALETAVKKLTDGRTQADFFEELYKQPRGNKSPDTSAAKKELTTAEQHAAAVKIALENSGWMGQSIAAANKDFFLTAAENDLEIDAQIAVLEFALKIRSKYRHTPRPKREAMLPEILAEIAQNDPLRHSELSLSK